VDKEIYWEFFKRLAISLPLVLLLAYVVIRYLGRKNLNYAGRRRMRVLEQLWLGAKAAIYLVEVGGNYFLIGQQEGGLFLLKELDERPALLEGEESGLQEMINMFSANCLSGCFSKNNQNLFTFLGLKWPALPTFLGWNRQKKHDRKNKE